MLDYLKLWISDGATIQNILTNPVIEKDYVMNEDGVLLRICGKFKNWRIKTISPRCLEIAGSLHKYYNEGTNENDFTVSQIRDAIAMFSEEFGIDPSLAFVKNLEFGVNLQIHLNASDVIDQIVCFNKVQPMRPYAFKPDCYFIEFKQSDYYFKVYDKGRQYRATIPNMPNTLRIEVKAMNSRFLQFADVITLADLKEQEAIEKLAVKLQTILKGLVFDDDSIDSRLLPLKEKTLYEDFCNPRTWKLLQKKSTSTSRKKVRKFKEIVEKKGRRKIYTSLSDAVKKKINLLVQ